MISANKIFSKIGRGFFSSAGIVTAIFFLFGLFLTLSCHNRVTEKRVPAPEFKKVIIEAEINKHFYSELHGILEIKEVLEIKYASLNSIVKDPPELQTLSENMSNGKAKWIVYTEDPVIILPPLGNSLVMRPGDSIHIKYLDPVPEYSGNNIQTCEMLNKLMQAEQAFVKPVKKLDYYSSALEEFTVLNQYYDNELNLQSSVVEDFKDKVLKEDYEYYKAGIVNSIERKKLNIFSNLRYFVMKKKSNLTPVDLASIWDSTQCGPGRKWLETLSIYYDPIRDFYTYNKMEVLRKFNFNIENDSIAKDKSIEKLFYNNAKYKYKGMVKDRLLAYILRKKSLDEEEL